MNLLISQCVAYLSIIVHLCIHTMYSVCTMLGDRNTCTFLRIHSCADNTGWRVKSYDDDIIILLYYSTYYYCSCNKVFFFFTTTT